MLDLLADLMSARLLAAVFVAYVAGFLTGMYVMERVRG